MPAPDINMLNQILDLYVRFDKPQDEEEGQEQGNAGFTFAKKIVKAAETFTDYVTGNSAVKKKLECICETVYRSINSPNKEAKDWAKLCTLLGNKAEEAQQLKKTSGQSRCCEILHCIRNAIIVAIKSDNGEFKQAYEVLIAELKTTLEEDKRTSDNCITYKNGDNYEQLDIKINQTLLQLAYLEDAVSIHAARRLGLLNYLLSVKEREDLFKQNAHLEKQDKLSVHFSFFNLAFPYALQARLAEVHYIYCYQKRTQISYDEFCTKGIPKEKLPTGRTNELRVDANYKGQAGNIGFYSNSQVPKGEQSQSTMTTSLLKTSQ